MSSVICLINEGELIVCAKWTQIAHYYSMIVRIIWALSICWLHVIQGSQLRLWFMSIFARTSLCVFWAAVNVWDADYCVRWSCTVGTVTSACLSCGQLFSLVCRTSSFDVTVTVLLYSFFHFQSMCYAGDRRARNDLLSLGPYHIIIGTTA